MVFGITTKQEERHSLIIKFLFICNCLKQLNPFFFFFLIGFQDYINKESSNQPQLHPTSHAILNHIKFQILNSKWNLEESKIQKLYMWIQIRIKKIWNNLVVVPASRSYVLGLETDYRRWVKPKTSRRLVSRSQVAATEVCSNTWI